MKTSELTALYLDVCRYDRQLSPNTLAAYAQDYRRFSNASPIAAFDALQQQHIKQHIVDLVDEGRLSASTIRRHVASLRSLCRYAFVEYEYSDAFLRWSPKIRIPKRLPRAVELSAIQTLTAEHTSTTAATKQTVFLVFLLCATGIRISELCGIRLGDVRSDGGSIVIHGKGSKERVVYVGDQVLRCSLAARKAEETLERGQSGRLVVNRNGDPLQPQAIRKRLHRLRIRTGLAQRVTPHMFRHTTATLLIENGVDIRYVQRLLGHSSISTTQIYTQVTDTALRDAVYAANPITGLTESRIDL